jgi:hypothetical protein
MCSAGFYRTQIEVFGSPKCEPCACNGNGNTCDPVTGKACTCTGGPSAAVTNATAANGYRQCSFCPAGYRPSVRGAGSATRPVGVADEAVPRAADELLYGNPCYRILAPDGAAHATTLVARGERVHFSVDGAIARSARDRVFGVAVRSGGITVIVGEDATHTLDGTSCSGRGACSLSGLECNSLQVHHWCGEPHPWLGEVLHRSYVWGIRLGAADCPIISVSLGYAL